MKTKGDTGAYLRTTMGAMVLFGAPPEPYWPYTDDEASFDREPPAFCYSFAQSYRTLLYYRHDPAGATRAEVLERLKNILVGRTPGHVRFHRLQLGRAGGDDGTHPAALRPGEDRGRARRRRHGIRRQLGHRQRGRRRPVPRRVPHPQFVGQELGRKGATAGCLTTTSGKAWPRTSGRSSKRNGSTPASSRSDPNRL